MEENLNKLITTLTGLVDELRTQKTGDVVDQQRSENSFLDPLAIKKKEQENQAKINAEESSKKQKEDRKKQPPAPRKIRADVMPVSIVSIDRKVLNSLAKIMPTSTALKEKKEDQQQSDDFNWKTLLLGGAIGLVVAPVVALFAFFEEIGKQQWFKRLKGFLKTKFWKPLSNFFIRISGWFDTLKTKLDPVSKKIKQLLKNTRKTFKPIETILTGINKRIQPIIKSMQKMLVPIFGDGKGKASVFKKIGDMFLKNPAFKAVTSFAKGVGKLLGKLFLPITVIFGIIETISGFMKGYEQGGVASGITGGFQSLFEFLIGDIIRFLTSIPAKVLEWIGLPATGAALTANVEGMLTQVNQMIGNVVDMVVGVFTFDLELARKAGLALFGDAVDFAAYAAGLVIDPVVTFFNEVFKFGDPTHPFSFKIDIVDPVLASVKKWFTTLISFGETTEGRWSLAAWVNNLEIEITKWFKGMYTWVASAVESFSLTDTINSAYTKATEWVIGVFKWSGIPDTFSLTTTVKQVWEDIKGWFTGLIKWVDSDETAGEKDGFIITIVKDVITKVEKYFAKLFDFNEKNPLLAAFDILMYFPNMVVSGLGLASEWLLKLFGFDETADSIKEWTDMSISKMVSVSVSKAWEWLTERFPDVTKYLTTTWDKLTGKVANVGTYIWDGVKGVWEWFEDLWSDPEGTLKRSWNQIATGVTNVGDWLWTGVEGVWKWMKDTFDGMLSSIAFGWNQIATGVTNVGDWLWTGVGGVWKWMKDTFDGMLTSIKSGWNAVSAGVTNVGDWLWTGVDGVWRWMKDTFDGMKLAIKTGWNTVSAGVTNVGDWLWDKISGVWSWVTAMWSDPKTTIKLHWDQVATGVNNVGDWLWDKISGVWSWVSDMFPDLELSIKTGWDKMSTGVTNVGEYISGKITSAWKWLDDMWSNMDIKGHLPDWVSDPSKWIAGKMDPVFTFLDKMLDMDVALDYMRDKFNTILPDSMKLETSDQAKSRRNKAAVREEMSKVRSDVSGEIFGNKDAEYIASRLKWAELDGDKGRTALVDARINEVIKKKFGNDPMSIESSHLIRLALDKLSDSNTATSKKIYKALAAHYEKVKIIQDSEYEKQGKELMELVDKYERDNINKTTTQVNRVAPMSRDDINKTTAQPVQVEEKTTVEINKVSATPIAPRRWRTLEENKLLLDSIQRIPKVKSPPPVKLQDNTPTVLKPQDTTSSVDQWKSFDINIMNGLEDPRKVYKQSIESTTNNQTIDNQSKVNDAMGKKLDKMVEIMSETADTQQKTLVTLKEHGLVDKQGNTVVNNGGNSTNVTNVTRDSDIISHRNKAIGRLSL